MPYEWPYRSLLLKKGQVHTYFAGESDFLPVTVSMGLEMKGVLIVMFLVIFVDRSTLLAGKSTYPGRMRKSLYVRPPERKGFMSSSAERPSTAGFKRSAFKSWGRVDTISPTELAILAFLEIFVRHWTGAKKKMHADHFRNLRPLGKNQESVAPKGPDHIWTII